MFTKNDNYNEDMKSKIRIDKGYSSDMTVVHVGSLTLYFSYSTVIAFEDTSELFISENIWSRTTGKHLNWISRHKDLRLPYEEFEIELQETLNKYNLEV